MDISPQNLNLATHHRLTKLLESGTCCVAISIWGGGGADDQLRVWSTATPNKVILLYSIYFNNYLSYYSYMCELEQINSVFKGEFQMQ